MTRRLAIAAYVGFPLSVGLSCGGGDSGPTTSTPASPTVGAVTRVDAVGPPSTVAAGTNAVVTVKASTASGSAAGGASISFVVADGGGAVAPATATTGSDGQATTTWTLGAGLGPQSLTASVSGTSASARISVTAVAGPAKQIAKVGGDAQSAAVSVALQDSLAVKIMDQFGNPVGGAQVLWAVTAGGGTISPTSSNTSSIGIAKAAWTLGPGAAAQSATAAVAGISALSFSATGLAPVRPVFTVSPLKPTDVLSILPLGNLNPPQHTFPTDHIYFALSTGATAPANAFTVYAPTSGRVTTISGRANSGDFKVQVSVTGTVSYYLDHITPRADLAVGTTLAAGEVVGSNSGAAGAVDLGVIDLANARTGLINPKRYAKQTVYGDAPLSYYVDPLQATLYAKVQRTGSDKNGKFDLDVPGRLVGNWFLQDLPVDSSANSAAWGKQIAFVYDPADPATKVISVGGALSVTGGVYQVAGLAPDFASVGTASGPVGYQLYRNSGPGGQLQLIGLLMVQLTADDQIKIETFAGETQTTRPFTNAAVIFTR